VTRERLPSRQAFRRRIIGLSFAHSTPGLVIVLAYLLAILDLTAEQLRWLVGFTALWATLCTLPMMRWQARAMEPILRYLDDPERLHAEGRRRAFAALIDLPRRLSWFGAAGWVVPCAVAGPVMALRWSSFGAFGCAVLMMAGVAAGFVAASYLLFLIKRAAEPVRAALAREIPDAERGRLVRPLPIGVKLLTCVTGVAVIPVLFAVMLSQVRAGAALERLAIDWQHAALGALAADAEAGGEPRAPGPFALEVVDLARLPEGGAGALDAELVAQLRAELAAGRERGDSAALASERVFAWRQLEGERVLLASLPREALRFDAARLWLVLGALLVVSTGVALGLAVLLAGDVSGATEVLKAEAERLASGDLRPGRVFESEDELGELARSFEGMARSLRETVSRVAEAADRVEATAGEVARESQSVAEVTGDQVRGIEQTTSSMEAINAQVRGIADSSQALNVSVEESSSSILELGAAGEELNETASVLSRRVAEVSGSIEQMVRSVKQVLENTRSLSEAAAETSASMEEMATSMREVDASAAETARLGQQVATSAESGQAKVRQTIEGMEAIREATETAEAVIRSLGGRAKEIGAIVDVIDDVADETNLLALNAAIIAAQAGEHGRAFSVVADEIKDLAERVLASTKEIGSLIRAVQDEADNARGAVERGAESVAGGVDLSAEAGVSLEEITRASRESVMRIAGIVGAVREQARAAVHVVELMERVRGGVESIGRAGAEQDRGNEVVFRSAVAMREVAQQVRATTEEQARGSGRIAESIEGVREAVEQIHGSLQEQSATCRSAVEFLEALSARTRANEHSAGRLDEAAKALLKHAETLREDARRFQI
jgi:methyl-accepting chemotaxis protein